MRGARGRLAQVGVGGVDDVLRADVAVADGDVEVVAAGGLQRLQRGVEHFFGAVDAFLAERLGQCGAAGVDVALALLLGDVAADAGAGLAGDDEAFPGRAGGAAAGGHDLDLVAVLQLVAKRHQAAVDLGADAGVADHAVDGVGEIDAGGAARELDQLALGREAEDLVLVELELRVLQEFVGGLRVLEDLEQVLDPAELLQVAGGCVALLVEPVRGHAVFSDVVHVRGPDLHLDLLVLRDAEGDAGVDAAVAVRLGGADVVLEAPGDHGIRGMDRAQGHVAGVAGRHDDAEGHDVGQLLEGDVAALHLLPDREDRLLPAGDLDRSRPGFGADAGELLLHLLDDVGALAAEEVEARLDGVKGFGLELCESKGLQLGLQAVHADAFGERRVDLHGFAGDALPFLELVDEVEGTHVVEAVGELDQEDTDVLAHGEHEFAEVLGLLGAVGLEFEPGQLGDAVDEAADDRAEAAVDLGAGYPGILDDMSCRSAVTMRGGVETVAGQDVSHGEGVGDVGVAVFSGLLAVRLHCEHISGVEHVRVGARIVGPNLLGQLELADDLGALQRGRPLQTGRSDFHPARGPGREAARGAREFTGAPSMGVAGN